MHQRVNILGVGVSAIDMALALDAIDGWIEDRSATFVCIRDVHGIMASQHDEAYRAIHSRAGMVTPDGMPVVWAARMMGYRHVRKVSGTDLMAAVCERSISRGHRHFLYGGAPGVADELAAALERRFAGVRIVGTHSPPFRPLGEAESAEMIRMINRTEADIVWVGLGSPKQEYWMAEQVGKIAAPVLIGVGAAFDFLSGHVSRAPVWMQRSGLEWLYRLASEPRRLWRRYLVTTPRFIPLVLMQIMGLRKYPEIADDASRADSAR